MINVRRYPNIMKVDAVHANHFLPRIATAAAICLTVILIFCPSVHSRGDLRCGDKVRIILQTGNRLQGRLTKATKDSLEVKVRKRNEVKGVALDDVASLYRIKRYTGIGILAGSVAGTGLGIVVAKRWLKNREPRTCSEGSFICFDMPIAETTAIILGGTLVGAVVGGTIGHCVYSLGEVQLEATPMCISPSGKVEPLGVTFALNF